LPDLRVPSPFVLCLVPCLLDKCCFPSCRACGRLRPR
jgi:hypothetical protein